MCKNLWMYLKSPHGCLESELWMEPPLSPCVGTKFCYDIPDRWSVSLCLTLPTRRSSLRCESLSSIYIQSWLLEASSVHELENTFADYFIIEASFFLLTFHYFQSSWLQACPSDKIVNSIQNLLSCFDSKAFLHFGHFHVKTFQFSSSLHNRRSTSTPS